VTISSTEYHFMTGEGVVTPSGLDNLREEIEQVGVDVVSAHLPRTADWAAATSARVQALQQALAKLQHPMPLYLNEERRAETSREPLRRGVYLAAFGGARTAGAAGWVFHTAAGYSLERQSFVAALNPEERRALESIGAEAAEGK
jgi:hypothetical protein